MNVNKVVLSVLSIALKCIAVIAVVFLLYHGGRSAYDFGEAVFLDTPVTSAENAREITVTIPQGSSPMDIGKILEDKNLIRDSLVFYVQTFCVEEGSLMKAGSYELNTSMTAEEMIETMAADTTKGTGGE